jgi:hypothetical protein
MTVEGPFSPSHSNCMVVGATAAEDMFGVDHISTRFTLTASKSRTVVVALVAIVTRFNKFDRTMLLLKPALVMKRNL